MGIVVDAEDQEALNEGIIRSMNGNVKEMASNGRIYAETYLSVGKIMSRFEEAVIVR
jgi:colanic acid biosynthesis glycosyl transferase WcaI